MKKQRIKVAITGAAGQIGYALVFRVASGQMFGPEIEVELQLLELENALPALQRPNSFPVRRSRITSVPVLSPSTTSLSTMVVAPL